MADTILNCSCCGTALTLAENESVRTCPACGTPNAQPRSTGATREMLSRAITQRLSCDFHNAELSYQQVLLLNPDEHEALWGRLLCHYGVEYVSDPATGRLTPTVHAAQLRPMQEQPDFINACDFAPPQVREQYEKDAAYIDNAQMEIRRLAQGGPDYDVFLCHKTTRPGTHDKTEDFHRATQLYHFLRDAGVRVFFAPECLPGAAGANYEAGIYHALHAARVMLVLCSDADYLTSPWVRSEWSRFLALVDEAKEKRLIPLLYGGFSPSQLPAPFRFRKLQGLNMSDITAPQTLLTLMGSLLEKPADSAARPAPAGNAVPVSASVVQQGVPERKVGEVVFEFPRLIPEWKRAPGWKVVIDDKENTVLTPVKWTKATLLPLSESVSVTVREDRVSRLWPLYLPLGTIAAFFLGGWATFFIYCVGFLVTVPAFLWWYIRKIRRHLRKQLTFTITPGKRYRLYWDESEKLAVEELG